MDRKHVVAGVFCLAVSMFVAVNAISLGLGTISYPGPGFTLFWASVGLGGLAIVQIFKSIFRQGGPIPLSSMWKGLKWQNAALAMAMLFLYAFGLPRVGYVLSTFVLMAALFGIGRIPLRVVIPLSLITAILSFAIFRYGLNVHLP